MFDRNKLWILWCFHFVRDVSYCHCLTCKTRITNTSLGKPRSVEHNYTQCSSLSFEVRTEMAQFVVVLVKITNNVVIDFGVP